MSLSRRQQRKYFPEEAPVQQISSAQSSTAGTAGVPEGMNGSNMNSAADRLIWVDLEVSQEYCCCLLIFTTAKIIIESTVMLDQSLLVFLLD